MAHHQQITTWKQDADPRYVEYAEGIRLIGSALTPRTLDPEERIKNPVQVEVLSSDDEEEIGGKLIPNRVLDVQNMKEYVSSPEDKERTMDKPSTANTTPIANGEVEEEEQANPRSDREYCTPHARPSTALLGPITGEVANKQVEETDLSLIPNTIDSKANAKAQKDGVDSFGFKSKPQSTPQVGEGDDPYQLNGRERNSE